MRASPGKTLYLAYFHAPTPACHRVSYFSPGVVPIRTDERILQAQLPPAVMETGVCPFQVSVGVARLKTLVVDSTERDNGFPLSLSVSIGLRLQATVKSGPFFNPSDLNLHSPLFSGSVQKTVDLHFSLVAGGPTPEYCHKPVRHPKR